MSNREKGGQSVPILTGKDLRLGSLRTTETTQGINLVYKSNHKTSKGDNDENCDIKNNNLILKRIHVYIMDLNPYHTSKQH